MSSPVALNASRTYPVPVDEAFDRVLALPLPTLFRHRFGPMPPIREVRGQGGDWGTVGADRTIALTGGGTMRETLTRVERPDRFDYRISDVTGPMTALATAADGSWRFEPAGTGVRVTWVWEVTPRPRATAAMPAFGWSWRGYARRALAELEGQLLP